MLVAILGRFRQNAKAMALFFKKAGLEVDEANITLTDIKILFETNPEVLNDCMNYLYPNGIKEFGIANADSSFDWKGFLGGLFGGVGAAFSQMSDSSYATTAANTAIANAEYEKELAEQKAASTRTTLMIVLAILVVCVVAGIFIFKKRF